ncbi:MAG: insulinase family protein [Bacteroidales bacterium]|nr:insulinase family protein [Bacteroidales bacterium]
MKKFFFLLSCLLVSSIGFAQQQQMPAMPLDTSVRVGHLDNGLTYFIKHNANPENRAEFYIATNVGAINETPAQRGLAHFLEHMCFNGNKDFPGNTMMSYLEKNGLIFGANINAMTGVESTVYTLSTIPTDRKNLVDTALVILQNDAAFVTNDFGEVEKERGVIIEEWRSGNTAQRRQQEALFKVLYKGTKYADCNVIGDEECLLGFDPQELVNFYKTWYYPGNQAIIVVGDVDVDYVEGKIKEFFSVIPKKENEPAKEVINVPGNEEPLTMVFTDPEIMATSLLYINKQPALPKQLHNTQMYFMIDNVKSVIRMIINERLSDESKKADAPFTSASFSMTNFMETMDGVFFQATPKPGKIKESMDKSMEIIRQAQKFGFSQDEFDRAKANILRSYQAQEDRAATRRNSELAMQYVQYFLDNQPYCEPSTENQMAQMIFSQLTVDAINQMMGQGIISLENSIIGVIAPKKEEGTLPSEAQLSDWLKAAFQAEIQAPKGEEIAKELIDPATIKSGKVKKEEKGYQDCTVWTLSNGVQVYLYPTEVRKDAVSFLLIQDGGQSVLPQELLPSFEDNVRYFYAANSGVGQFPANTVRKMLAGKNASAMTFVNDDHSGINANSSPKDMELALQLMYLHFTQPRCEDTEFETTMSQMKSIAENIGSNPEFQFQEMLAHAMTNNSPRTVVFSKELVEKVNTADIRKGNAMLFGDAAGAKLFVVGDFEVEALKPLVEKYIASLPVKSKKARTIVDHKLYPADGINEVTKAVKMENPNSYVYVVYQRPQLKNLENSIITRAMTYIMNMRYITSLREEDGGTYSPRVSGQVSSLPNERNYFTVSIETSKEKAPVLIEKIYAGIEKLAADGPTDEEMGKTIEMMKKNIPESKKNPSYWSNLLENYYLYGYDIELTEEKIDKFVTKENVQNAAKAIISAGNRLTVVENPE